MRTQPRRHPAMVAVAAALALGALTMTASPASAQDQGKIVISYEKPKTPAVQEAYDMATGAKGLEMMQVIFSPFRLPEDLYMKAVNCDGVPNAYFFREDDKPTIRLCYEFLSTVYGMMPKKPTPEGITPREAFTGQLLFAIAHEFGHAAFDIYNVPVLGRQEDAADEFSAHYLLNLGGDLSYRLIRGAAYTYHDFIQSIKDKPKLTVPALAFSSDHGSPEQRFFNLVCIAYGYDPQMFAEVVDRGFLPEARAKVCKYEYSNLAYAIKKLIGPHIDEELAAKAKATTAAWSTAPFWHKPDAAK
jgi:hypothetical protein